MTFALRAVDVMLVLLTCGAAAVETAIATLNGSDYAPLWYHELTP